MVYVFRSADSVSARLLAQEVDGIRLKQEVNLRRRVRPTDKIVMWGAYVPNIIGKVINNVPLRNKFEDAIMLKEAGIRTVEVSRTMPQPVVQPTPVDPLIAVWNTAADAAEAFIQLEPTRSQVARDGISDLVRMLTVVYEATGVPAPMAPPPQPVGTWLARKFNHVGGNDLLNPNTIADYYSKKEDFINEYRVHSFFGRSIRSGKKIHRTIRSETPFYGTPHAWVRSFNAGWQISYANDVGVKQKHRDIAHQAVKALGLSFGAVDIGEKADGTLVVLEVNRAPGVEGGTTEAYSRAIRRWVAGEWTHETIAVA